MKPGVGKVASLHLHPRKGGEAMVEVQRIEAVAGRGIVGDPRYFGRMSRRTGQPSRRQVTLIEREVLVRHAHALRRASFLPGDARANIETEGMDLAPLVGRRLRLGSMLLEVIEHREPCAKMDALQPGLRALMTPPCQGVIAVVLESGEAVVGDTITACEPGDLGSAESGGGHHGAQGN